MEIIAKIVLNHKKTVIGVFTILVVICGLLMTAIEVNTDNSEYLPDDINSKKAAVLLEEEFEIMGTASLMMNSKDILEIMLFKQKILKISGVREVLWLDDVVDINTPMSHIAKEYKDIFYKEDHALFQIFFHENNDSRLTGDSVNEIEDLLAADMYFTGPAVSSNSFMSRTFKELPIYMIVAVVLILLILIFSTESWIEPLIFMAAIGIAIIINMGTNIFISREVSTMTISAAAVLQLAVSMDYAIFMLHRFHDERKKGKSIRDAVISAMKKSAVAILGSAFTTIAGFLALMIMDFGNGRELGLVLAKGVAISLITVLLL
ncbi:MAG: MMPL family transporter, partial [Clostridiales bacterium]|nr:MMPL family transporter [Clostridiales bacterium]